MDNTLFEKLKANIQHTGRIQPIVVRPYPNNKNHFIMIDGHQRLKVAQSLGWTEIYCETWDVDEKQASLLLASLNRLRGEDHPCKRAELINGLLDEFDKALLASLIPESTEQIDDLLALLSAEEASINDTFKQHLEKEEDAEQAIIEHIEQELAELPTTLQFVVSQEEAKIIQSALSQFDPKNNNNALVLMCQEASRVQ